MKFLLDASMPRAAPAALRAQRHAVEHARDINLGDAADERFAEYARATRAAPVTRDLDFADTRRYPPAEFAGLSFSQPVKCLLTDSAPQVTFFESSDCQTVLHIAAETWAMLMNDMNPASHSVTAGSGVPWENCHHGS